MATKKQTSTVSPQLEPTFGDVEVDDGHELSYLGAKVDVLGTQAILTVNEDGRPRRIDRITQARMMREGDLLVFVGISDRLRNEVGTNDAEVRWIVTPRHCVDCGG